MWAMPGSVRVCWWRNFVPHNYDAGHCLRRQRVNPLTAFCLDGDGNPNVAGSGGVYLITALTHTRF